MKKKKIVLLFAALLPFGMQAAEVSHERAAATATALMADRVAVGEDRLVRRTEGLPRGAVRTCRLDAHLGRRPVESPHRLQPRQRVPRGEGYAREHAGTDELVQRPGGEQRPLFRASPHRMGGGFPSCSGSPLCQCRQGGTADQGELEPDGQLSEVLSQDQRRTGRRGLRGCGHGPGHERGPVARPTCRQLWLYAPHLRFHLRRFRC